MVDSLDVMKHTPLFRACEMGYRDVILTLIKGRCDHHVLYVKPLFLGCVISVTDETKDSFANLFNIVLLCP